MIVEDDRIEDLKSLRLCGVIAVLEIDADGEITQVIKYVEPKKEVDRVN